MNGLEALEKIHNNFGLADNFSGDFLRKDIQEEMLEPIEKELKALEIIKRTALRLVSLEDETTICRKGKYAFYDAELYLYVELTKDEFNLMKEVLE